MRHTAAMVVLTLLLSLAGPVIWLAVLLAPPITMARRGGPSLTSVAFWLLGLAFLFGWGPDLQFGEASDETPWLYGWEQVAAAMVAASLAVLTVLRRSSRGGPRPAGRPGE